MSPKDGWAERVARKKRRNAEILKSRMRVFPGHQALGRQVFADGAISRKHKELMALAVAVSQNCFD
jgi:alkylhydroperoxidase/carboxymuconolactone decarboxylase family protein YurZ